MNISFEAQHVSYAEAIDGEIVQVSFEEDGSDDAFNLKTLSLSVSVNYEFDSEATIEWFDGIEDSGGAKVQSCKIDCKSLEMSLSNGINFSITYSIDDVTINKIINHFDRVFKCIK